MQTATQEDGTKATNPGPVMAYHIVAIINGKPTTRHGLEVTVGSELHEDSADICSRGLHASRRLLDAAAYAPTTGAPVVCKVELRNVVQEQEDKLVALDRKVLAMFPAHEFMVRVANGAAARAEQYAAGALDLTIPIPTEQEALDIERNEWESEAEKEFAKYATYGVAAEVK